MENKINVAELLKDCPKGMELDCALFNNYVTLNKVADDDEFPITIETAKGDFVTLTKYGTYAETEEAKCVIFPKGKTTWEGFVPPCKFKDGDIVFSGFDLISIFKGIKNGYSGSLHSYVSVRKNDSMLNIDRDCWTLNNIRLATEEEKARLFQAIKDNGYKWNPETKTLEKLIEQRFKVGDRIKLNDSTFIYTITDLLKDRYIATVDSYGLHEIEFERQDAYKLVPNKFDINTLKPFDKVLVRDFDNTPWEIEFFSRLLDGKHFRCLDLSYMQCIPYEPNKELLGTTDDCGEYFKTWK